MNITIIYCQCGGLISDNFNQDALDKLLRNHKNNTSFVIIPLACSEDNKQLLIDKIKENKTEGIIFMGCTPNFKGAYLRELAQDAGVNPYMISFVNIREQALWVTEDKNALYKKVKALLNGCIERLKRQRPMEEHKYIVCKDVLVVGSGASGIQSALTLSQTGHKVYLVERTNYLGGRAVTYEKLFPNLECGPCKLHPLIDEVVNCNSIKVMQNSDILDVRGSWGNYFIKVLCKKNYVDVKRCIGCFMCVEACPERCISIDLKRQPLIAKIDYSRCLLSKGIDCKVCINECPVDDTINFEVTDRVEEIKVGAVILATGFSLFDCLNIESLGYKKYDDIYTSEEFEDILNAQGSTKGKILTKSGKVPQRIGIIHCVGSLDDDYIPYCSKICCQVAFKFNRQIRETLPNASISHFVREIVIPGKTAHKLYDQSKSDKLTEIIRYNSIGDLTIKKDDENLLLFWNRITFMYDIIVLMPGMICSENHELNSKGILYAGSVKEPMSIDESLRDSMSVVAHLLASTKGGEYFVKDFAVAQFNDTKCSKCSTCINQCPYKAIDIQDSRIKIIEELCEGCGSCVASCPCQAIELEGFTKEQIIAEIDGILNSIEER